MSELPRSIEQFTDRDFLLEFDGSSAELLHVSSLTSALLSIKATSTLHERSL